MSSDPPLEVPAVVDTPTEEKEQKEQQQPDATQGRNFREPSAAGHVFNVILFRPDLKAAKSTHEELLGHELARDVLTALPAQFRINVPFAVYDQGPIGSCTANATCAAFKLQIPAGKSSNPSRMFQYYVVRAMEHWMGQEGAIIDDY